MLFFVAAGCLLIFFSYKLILTKFKTHPRPSSLPLPPTLTYQIAKHAPTEIQCKLSQCSKSMLRLIRRICGCQIEKIYISSNEFNDKMNSFETGFMSSWRRSWPRETEYYLKYVDESLLI